MDELLQANIPSASSLFLKLIESVHLTCEAMRKAIEGYPEEMKKLMPQLFDMWFAHLADSIQSELCVAEAL